MQQTLTRNQHDGFLYEQVVNQVMQMMESNTLRIGERLPSLRKMSKQLNVSIATVMQAYVQLESQGRVETRPQSGFYVKSRPIVEPSLPKPTRPRPLPRRIQFGDDISSLFSLSNVPGVIPLGVANPAHELLPSKGLTRALKKVASLRPVETMSYCYPPGDAGLRRQIALRSMERGVNVSPDDFIITTGATEALSISLQAVARPGDAIAVESPTYFCLLQIIERLGMMAVEICTNPDTGMCVDSLAQAIQTVDIKAVISVANFNNPTGALIPDENKKTILDILARKQIPLIEDDIFGDLHFSQTRPHTFKAFDREGLVLTCSSFSKTIAPGYRVGWVSPGRYFEPVLQLKQLVSSATASIPQLTIAEFLRSGLYERHLVRLRRAYREQLEQLRQAVAGSFPKGTRLTRPEGGFVLWVQMPRGVDAMTLHSLALNEHISVTPGSIFSATGKYRNFIRLCAGSPWNDKIAGGVARLGEVAGTLAN